MGRGRTGVRTTRPPNTGNPVNFNNWKVPSETVLKREYRVEYEIKPLSNTNIFPTYQDFKNAVENADIITLTPEEDKRISNRSRTQSRQSLINLLKTYASWPKYRNEKTIDAIYQGFRNGNQMELPMVIEFKDGSRRIFAGNTRLDIAFQLGINPKVLIIKAQN